MTPKAKNRLEANDTKSEILENLLCNDLTALDLSDMLGINESAVRRHLNKLKSSGLVEAYFEKAEKGRPKKYFSITDEGKELFPRQIELLLELVIKNLREEFDEEVTDKLADKLVYDLQQMLPTVYKEEDFDQKIEKIVEGFDELGFYSSFYDTDGQYKVKYRNCAFGNLSSEEAGWLCDIHRRVIEEMLEDPEIEQERSMLEGDKSCVQMIGE